MSSFSFGFLLAIITPPEEYIFMAIYTNFVTGSNKMDEFIYCINIIAFVFLYFAPSLYLTKKFKLDIYNPLLISVAVSFATDLFRVLIGPIFGIKDGLFNNYYQYALFINNTQLLMNLILSIAFTKLFYKDKKLEYNLERIKSTKIYNRQNCIIYSFILLCIAILFFIILANKSYSVIEWIKNPRLGYQLHRTGAGAFYAFYLFFLSVSFTVAIVYAKNNVSRICLFIFYLFFIRLLGSKGQYLYFFITLYSVLWFNKYKYLKILLLLGLPIIAILMLLNFNSTNLISIFKYFDQYVNSSKYYEYYFNYKIPLLDGKIMLTNLWSYVPRSFYPDKPIIYGILYINEIFFPGQAAKTNTPEFGGPVALFADFGFWGVVFFSLINVSLLISIFCKYNIFKKYNYESIKSNSLLFLLFLSTFAPSFLRFFGFPYTLILIIFIYITFCFTIKINYKELIIIK